MKNKTSKSAPADGLRQLFLDSIKDIYWAEKAITRSMPKTIENATSEDLVDALTDHLEIVKEQVVRLEEIFTSMGEVAEGKKCEAMTGLITESEQTIQTSEEGDVRDAGIILAEQKISHYKIATYGTLCSFARTLGENYIASLLEETLNEEKDIDQKLSEIAESHVNIEAAE